MNINKLSYLIFRANMICLSLSLRHFEMTDLERQFPREESQIVGTLSGCVLVLVWVMNVSCNEFPQSTYFCLVLPRKENEGICWVAVSRPSQVIRVH